MQIKLINNKGKLWKQFDKGYIKGFAFLNNQLLDECGIYEAVIKALDKDKLKNLLVNLNGNYSIILMHQEYTYLIADKLKTYPLLFSQIGREWLITDQSRVILENSTDLSLNNDAVTTFLTLGYLHGNLTFLNNCMIVSAGTYVKINHQYSVHQYHNHIYKKVSLTDEEIMKGCVESMENSIQRMISSIGNRPIWIPLSGGYDSRLLACVMKKMGVKNVKCFTYGIPESYEVRISKQVATILEFPWHYVEYTKEKFLSVANSPLDDDYILWAMNLNTTSHFQDFLAFKELKEKGVVEENAVIVPGHSGEILGRDQIPYNLLGSTKSVAELIFYRYFTWNNIKNPFKKRAIFMLGPKLNSIIAKNNIALTIDLFSNWNIQNRQSNFIVNAVRVYEYFGNDWRVPLWDDELSEFWFSLNHQKNFNVELYNRFLFEIYFKPMNVAIYKELTKSRNFAALIRLPFGIKDYIKNRITKIKYFKSIYDVNDLNYRSEFYLKKINSQVFNHIEIKKSKINAVMAAYQIDLIFKQINMNIIDKQMAKKRHY